MTAPAAEDLPPLDVRRPFTYAAGIAAGVTPGRLRGPGFRTLLRGVFIAADVPPHPLHGVVAALLVHQGTAYASHASAGRVYEVPLPAGLAEEHVSVLAAPDRHRRAGVRTHVSAPGSPVVRVRGVRVSAPEQAFVELADQLGLVDLVVVGDHLVRQGLVTPGQPVAHAATHGSPAARRAAGYVRRHVDSPMETRLRMLVVLAGLPEPAVNFTLHHADGRVRYRFDLSYPDLKVVVEYAASTAPTSPSGTTTSSAVRGWTGTGGSTCRCSRGASTAAPTAPSSGSTTPSPPAAAPTCPAPCPMRGDRTSRFGREPPSDRSTGAPCARVAPGCAGRRQHRRTCTGSALHRPTAGPRGNPGRLRGGDRIGENTSRGVDDGEA